MTGFRWHKICLLRIGMWEGYGYSLEEHIKWRLTDNIQEKSATSFVSTAFISLHITNDVANKKAAWFWPEFVDISKYL